MQRVLVLSTTKVPLMPCHPARGRQLLKTGQAAVYKQEPFTIILKERTEGEVQPVELKLDPGSKTTGIAIVGQFKRGWRVLWASELQHRGESVKQRVAERKAVRRNRRNRKTRYRPMRFQNRKRQVGWLAPSVRSRVENVQTWVRRLWRAVPVCQLALELVKFDTQKMQNPEISGVEYQQGELAGYEVREYLLLKWGYRCAYCGKQGVPLQIEHIVPRSRGGSHRVSNLTLACQPCNQKKGNRTAAAFGFPHLHQQAKQPLRDAAALNVTRFVLLERLRACGLPVSTGTGAQTKFNRIQQGYPKTHWLDAACVRETGSKVFVPHRLRPLLILATGRQRRQMCLMDKYGFPRTRSKASRFVHGFQSGDLVVAHVPSGNKAAGTHRGALAVRASGFFRVGTTDSIAWRFCRRLQLMDGYLYLKGEVAHSSPD